jgi:hypothetical protein
MSEHPEYLHVDMEPTPDEIRNLLNSLVDLDAQQETKLILGSLAVISPAERLAQNMHVTMLIMCKRKVRDILKEGLSPPEAQALLELDRCGCSERDRITARSLMNVKERWIMAKCTAGLFNRNRMSNAFLEIPEG